MLSRCILVFLLTVAFSYSLIAQNDDSEYFDTPDLPSNGLKVNIAPYFSHGELFISYERAIGDNFSLDAGVSILGDKYRPSYEWEPFGGKGIGGFVGGKYYFLDYPFKGWYSEFGYEYKEYQAPAGFFLSDTKLKIFGFTGEGGYRFLIKDKLGVSLGFKINYFVMKASKDLPFENRNEVGRGGRPNVSFSYHF